MQLTHLAATIQVTVPSLSLEPIASTTQAAASIPSSVTLRDQSHRPIMSLLYTKCDHLSFPRRVLTACTTRRCDHFAGHYLMQNAQSPLAAESQDQKAKLCTKSKPDHLFCHHILRKSHNSLAEPQTILPGISSCLFFKFFCAGARH